MVGRLSQFAQGPDVTGAISRGAVTGGQLAQLAQLQRQQRAGETVDRLLAEGAAAPGARSAAMGEAARTGGALAAPALVEAFNALDAPERERQAREAQIFAQELAGANDQATWDAARARLDANPNVDASLLSPTFDPNQRTSIINAAREVEDIVGGIKSPEELAQDIQLAQAGRSTGATTNITVGGSPIGKLINDRNALVASGVGADDPALQALNRQIELAAQEGLAEETEAATAAEGRQQAAQRTAGVVSDNVSNIRRLIQDADLPTTGLAGGILSNIGGTSARDIAASLDTIRANVGFGALQEMRNNSPNGGALGQVSERELALLTSTLANLEQSQSEAQLLRNLSEIERQFDVLTAGTPEERDALLASSTAASAPETGDVMPDQANMPRPATREGYDALPDGAWYIDPNGVVGRKGR